MPLGLVTVLILIAVWILHEIVGPSKPATGDVELGVGTVDGVYGNDTYYSRRQASIEIDPGNPAIDARMRELIYESNRVISEDDLDEARAEGRSQ